MIQLRRPKVGPLKCNIDKTIFQEQGQYGIRICINGDKGDLAAPKTYWFKGLPQSREVEACGLKETISWLGSMS